MDFHVLFMILGFVLAAYSAVGNDVIQALGTFISSNGKIPWYILWAYAGGIMLIVLFYGWFNELGVTYGRLNSIPFPETLQWWHILTPLVLMFITRFGIPVSTTFLLLSVFATKSIESMVIKSGLGYLVAFVSAIGIYMVVSRVFENRFIRKPIERGEQQIWVGFQWLSTGFLWSQWLIQDLANVYVYLPRGTDLTSTQFALSVVALLVMLGVVFYQRGGKILQIVTTKTNTTDIRSATFIDLIYGIILYVFKEWSEIPMSTTWVFVGLLSGRELMINIRLNLQAAFEERIRKEKELGLLPHSAFKNIEEEMKHPLFPRYSGLEPLLRMIGMDLLKIFTGLGVSLLLVFIISQVR